MYSRGPVATVHYNMRGFAPADPGVMVTGFVQRFVAALLGALALYFLSRRVAIFAEQVKIAALAIFAALVFTRLTGPVWTHHDWGYALYQLLADGISLLVAALIILKLLPKAPGVRPAEEAGASSELI